MDWDIHFKKMFSCKNIRIFLWMVLFVLVIRHFFIHPFKIRTSSMEPTLIGDPNCGDQILVDKFAWRFQDPKRWDVIVFRHPLNQSQTFIKRLVGLPGEKITIKNGNVYINDAIARKPDSIQDVLLYPVFSSSSQKIVDFWKFQGGGWDEKDGVLFLESTNLSWCYYAEEINNLYIPRNDGIFFRRHHPAFKAGGNYCVGELRISFDVHVHSSTGTMMLQIRDGQRRFLIMLGLRKKKSDLQNIGSKQNANIQTNSEHLTPKVKPQPEQTPESNQNADAGPEPARGISSILCYRGESLTPYQTVPFDFGLLSEETHSVTISNLDELLEISVNGKKVFSFDYSTTPDNVPIHTNESDIRFGGKNGSFAFSKIFVWRDIYYQGRRNIYGGADSWQVPAGHYFFLGDNSAQSHDSRDWKKFRMVLKNGIALEGDQQYLPLTKDNTYHFIDTYGVMRHVSFDELKEGMTTHIEEPFVPQDHLLGKGWAVFWPPTRAKIIR